MNWKRKFFFYLTQCKYEKLKLDDLRKWLLLTESKLLEAKAKEDLFSDSSKNDASKNLHKNMKAFAQNEKLKDATRSMYETEGTAIEIEGLLANNSETLKRSLNRVFLKIW